MNCSNARLLQRDALRNRRRRVVVARGGGQTAEHDLGGVERGLRDVERIVARAIGVEVSPSAETARYVRERAAGLADVVERHVGGQRRHGAR